MKRPTLLLLLLSLLFCFACGDDDDDNNDSHDGDDDDSVDDDDNDTGDDDDDATPQPTDSDDIAIAEIDAPNETTVRVTLSGDPGDEQAEQADIYSLSSPKHDLAIAAVDYNAVSRQVTLTTTKQALGLTYTLTIDPQDAKEALTADFPAADTAKLWAVDFGDPGFAQYEVTAYRAAIGDKCVVYLEEGMNIDNTDDVVTKFDEQIYPTLTDLFVDPPDQDDNGRILIFGLNGNGYYGGYFSPVDTFSEEYAWSTWGSHSNEKEMIYINVEGGTLDEVNIVPHEFQHLLYNHRHGTYNEYWDYHDEGLAECACHAAFGVKQGAVDYFFYSSAVAQGLSLVHWTWGMYDNYVQAYLWWTYLASRLNGVATYGELFDLDTGNPEEVNAWLTTELGVDFPTAQGQWYMANWIMDADGDTGYRGMMDWTPHTAPRVAAGTTSVNLEPFAGALFTLAETSVSYPGTQGDNIVYFGIDGDNNIDDAEPFDIDGGVLIVFNENQQHVLWPGEHSGPDIAATGARFVASPAAASPAWLDPPPVHPARLDALRAWRYGAIERLRHR